MNAASEFEIYVPTIGEDGKPFKEKEVQAIKVELTDFFGGLTDSKHRNDGFWKIGNHTVRDEVVIWKVLSQKGQAGEAFVTDIKRRLELTLNQDQILIIKKSVDIL